MEKEQAQLLVRSIITNCGWAQDLLHSVQDQADKITIASERVVKMRKQLDANQKMQGKFEEDWQFFYSKPEEWRLGYVRINSEFEYAKACYAIANSRIYFVLDLMKTVNTLYKIYKDNEETISGFIPKVGEIGSSNMENIYEAANKLTTVARKHLADVQEQLAEMNYKEIETQMKEDIGQFVDAMSDLE